ncbi:hypothetical protein BT69DRAFT_1280318 [Atractiella rhizophila]|nr:hypothetical protein BT69DRAFT_1280318 [Atractiella rhizophila]
MEGEELEVADRFKVECGGEVEEIMGRPSTLSPTPNILTLILPTVSSSSSMTIQRSSPAKTKRAPEYDNTPIFQKYVLFTPSLIFAVLVVGILFIPALSVASSALIATETPEGLVGRMSGMGNVVESK